MSAPSLKAFEYLEQLPGTTFKRLYQQPSAALAVFRRMLPHLVVCDGDALPAPATSLVRPGSLGAPGHEKEQSLSLLYRLHILTTTTATANSTKDAGPELGQAQALKLTDPFAKSLRLALTGGGSHRSFGVPCSTPEEHRVDVKFLDAFAKTQWEAILHYMVGSATGGSGGSGGGGGGGGAAPRGPSSGVKKLLEMGGLVEVKGRQPEITQAGFAFLLQDINTQIWTLLVFYLENAEGLNMDAVDVLSFLFMLGSLELDRDYTLASLTPTQIHMLDDLRDFGIIYRRESMPNCFWPTRLATTLTSDAGALRSVSASAGFDSASLSAPSSSSSSSSSSFSATAAAAAAESKGFIIVETNYRLYAYTSSPLQIAVLALFARLSTRFPNMVAGRITRESIRRAIARGITSDQIISYLSTHAHPQMRKQAAAAAATAASAATSSGGGSTKSSSAAAAAAAAAASALLLPPTVADQIRLWQIEGERMKATSGFLFKDFAGFDEYAGPCRYAEEIGVLVWRSDARRMFFVTRHEQVATYLRNRPKNP